MTTTATAPEVRPTVARAWWAILADDSWLRARPRVSAWTGFVLASVLDGECLWAASQHDRVTAAVALLLASAAGIFGALETGRTGVSAGHGGAT